LIFGNTQYATGQALKTLVMRMFGEKDYKKGLDLLHDLSKIARKGKL